jgi:hypothetical protein
MLITISVLPHPSSAVARLRLIVSDGDVKLDPKVLGENHSNWVCLASRNIPKGVEHFTP